MLVKIRGKLQGNPLEPVQSGRPRPEGELQGVIGPLEKQPGFRQKPVQHSSKERVRRRKSAPQKIGNAVLDLMGEDGKEHGGKYEL